VRDFVEPTVSRASNPAETVGLSHALAEVKQQGLFEKTLEAKALPGVSRGFKGRRILPDLDGFVARF
jgi:hypothetical protein